MNASVPLEDRILIEGVKFGRVVRDKYFELGKEVTYETFRLLAKKDLQVYDYQYPANWWEAVKDRFLPSRLKKKFPVIYTRIHVSIDAVFPELHKKIANIDSPSVMVVNHFRGTALHGIEE